MVRRYKPDGKKRLRPLYWLMVAAVISLWIWGFKLYVRRYDFMHPEVTWAVPGIEVELVAVDGALLWKEEVLFSPADGTVSYPQGRGPVRVSKGAVVAVVSSGSGSSQVKASQQGYFVAGIDGSEDSWKYSELWPGADPLPAAAPLALIDDGTPVARGQPVGKLAEQPQGLRFIGYAGIAGNMGRQIKNKRLKVKMDAEDTVSTADIRVHNDMPDGRVKLYLNLPWFQPPLLMSRNYRLIIEAGSIEGAVVPESALLTKNGARGVYIVRGARVLFRQVEGKSIDGGKFLVTDGLSVGDALVENAATAREGRIQLW